MSLMPPVRCITCGYDLRGTYRDGVCPECGTAASVSESQVPLSRRVRELLRRARRFIICALVLIAVLVLSYREGIEMRVCPDCARVSTVHFQALAIPFTRLHMIRLPEMKSLMVFREIPLVLHLDPASTCQHSWVTWADTYSSGLFYEYSENNPAYCWVTDAEDFDVFLLFLAEKYPEPLEEFRRHIREGDLSSWSGDEYRAWRGEAPPSWDSDEAP